MINPTVPKEPNDLSFTVYCRACPQGSMKAFVIGGKARLTSANKALKPYRQELTLSAMAEMQGMERPFAGSKVPVLVTMHFYLEKPQSVPKSRKMPAVKPDLDKLIRSTSDALTGVCWHDDGQIVEIRAQKHYGSPERVEISVSKLEAK